MSEIRGEAWSIIRRAMDTPHTDDFEAESAYRDAYASEAAEKVIALLADRAATVAETDVETVRLKAQLRYLRGAYQDAVVNSAINAREGDMGDEDIQKIITRIDSEIEYIGDKSVNGAAIAAMPSCADADDERIKDIIVGMRKDAMEQHDYGLYLSHSRRRADVLRDVLIATGLADADLVAEHEADIEAIRERLAAVTAELKAKEASDG